MLWFALRKFAAFVAIVLVTLWLIHALLAAAGGQQLGGFFGWLGHALIGDFGVAAADGQAIGGLVAARLAVTVPLALLAMLLAAIIGAGIGYLAARRPGRMLDHALTALAEIGGATPNFWLGMVLVAIFATGLHWLPTGGFVPWQRNVGGALLSLLLPALAVALPVAATLALKVRDAVAAARVAPYVLAAEARGVAAEHSFRREALPAAALVVLAWAVPQAATAIVGTIIVENVFYLPGLGRLILDAVGARDPALVAGALAVLTLLTAGATFLMQLGARWADPRRRGSGAP
jgi:peptide/nickel transport system permease protein